MPRHWSFVTENQQHTLPRDLNEKWTIWWRRWKATNERRVTGLLRGCVRTCASVSRRREIKVWERRWNETKGNEMKWKWWWWWTGELENWRIGERRNGSERRHSWTPPQLENVDVWTTALTVVLLLRSPRIGIMKETWIVHFGWHSKWITDLGECLKWNQHKHLETREPVLASVEYNDIVESKCESESIAVSIWSSVEHIDVVSVCR
jgi:hypothetical protein